MGHIAPVNSVDFASGNSDYLVTSGRDRAVKIWQWRSKTVKLNIDLRKCGRGTGLLKQYTLIKFHIIAHEQLKAKV